MPERSEPLTTACPPEVDVLRLYDDDFETVRTLAPAGGIAVDVMVTDSGWKEER